MKDNNSILAQSLQSGLSAFAAGGSMKQSGKALLGMGKQALFKKFAPGMMSMFGGGEAGGGQGGGLSSLFGGGGQGGGLSGMFGAKGKYVNSPTLMMVGEEGRGEIVIPTERIRKKAYRLIQVLLEN